MQERRIGIQEFETNLRNCLEEVRSGTTLVLTDQGHAVARLSAEPGCQRLEAWPGDRLERPAAEEEETQGAAARRSQHGRHHPGESQVTLLYMDSSALVKRYVVEDESPAVLERMDEAPSLRRRATRSRADVAR